MDSLPPCRQVLQVEGAAGELGIQERVSSIYGGGGVRWRLGGRIYYKNVNRYTDTFAYNHTVESSGRWAFSH